MSGFKLSQLPTLSNILETSIIAIVQAGKTYKTTILSLFANYYTKSQVDTIIENVVAGAVQWDQKSFDNLTIEANTPKQFVLNHDNIDFTYDVLVWDPIKSKYLKPQFPPVEHDRDKDSVTLNWGIAQTNFKIISFG